MLTSISPLGERARHNRWGVTVTWYTAASTLAAATAGALLGAVGALLSLDVGVAAALLAGTALLAAVADRTGHPGRGLPRQVNEDWLTGYRSWVYGAGFGVQLGLGVATIVTTAAVYLALVAELLAGSAAAGAAIGATFGLIRALPVIGGWRVSTFSQLAIRHRRLTAALPAVRQLTVAAMVTAAAAWTAIAISQLA